MPLTADNVIVNTALASVSSRSVSSLTEIVGAVSSFVMVAVAVAGPAALPVAWNVGPVSAPPAALVRLMVTVSSPSKVVSPVGVNVTVVLLDPAVIVPVPPLICV